MLASCGPQKHTKLNIALMMDTCMLKYDNRLKSNILRFFFNNFVNMMVIMAHLHAYFNTGKRSHHNKTINIMITFKKIHLSHGQCYLRDTATG